MEVSVGERWLSVNGLDGKYEVSNLGNVRSLERDAPHRYVGTQRIHARTLRQKTQKNGYRTVNLYLGDGTHRSEMRYVHRLVARAFHGEPPDGKPEINHKDGNKSNNHETNVEWASPLENTTHAWATGLSYMRGSKNPVSRLNESQVLEIVAMKGSASSTVIGRKFNVCSGTVLAIFKGRIWSHLTGIVKAG